MQKKRALILTPLLIGFSFISGDTTPTVVLSPNQSHTFSWKTCPTDKRPITSYITNIIHNPNNTIVTKQGSQKNKDGCTTYTFTITAHNALPTTQFTSESKRLGSFDISATYGLSSLVDKVATIVIKNERSTKNTTEGVKATPAQVTLCNQPAADACFAAMPLTIPSSTAQPMILSTSTSGITYTLDLSRYKGTKKNIVLTQVPNKPGETGTTYTLAAKNAPAGTFLIDQVEHDGVTSHAYHVTVVKE